MVEDMENKIRNTLNEIYFGKTKDIVNGLRSTQALSDQRHQLNLKDLTSALKQRGVKDNWKWAVDPDEATTDHDRDGTGCVAVAEEDEYDDDFDDNFVLVTMSLPIGAISSATIS